MMTTRNLTLALALRVTGMPVAYDPGKAGWKVDADGKIVCDSDGNPIYLDSSGRELALGTDTVARLNNEAKLNRERAETAESKLKTFDGLDPDKARGALDTVSKIDQKKLIDAGEVDKVRDEISKSFSQQIADRDKLTASLQDRVASMTRNGAFTSSKFAAEKIAVPLDMLQATFGNNFKVEDDKLIPYDASGNKIFSKKRAGEIATFDEALETLIDGYAHRDSILKGGNHSGTGNTGNGGSNGAGRVMRREAFNSLSPGEQAAAAGAMQKGELTIKD